MHEEEVAGVFFLAHALHHPGGHGDRRHSRRPDHGVDLSPAYHFHGLTQHDASGGAEDEGHEAEDDDLDGSHGEEIFRAHGGSHRQAEEDGGGVQDFVLSRLVQPFCHPALPKEVPEHEGSDQGHRRGKKQPCRHGAHDGEEHPFKLGDGAELIHPDTPVRLGGEQTDHRRLDQGDQGHVAVGGHRHSPQDLGGQLHGEVDACGAVGTAYDGDGRRLLHVEAEKQRAEQGDEDTQLGRRSQKEGDGVGQKGREVCQRAYTHEDDHGVDLMFCSEKDITQKASLVHDTRKGQVDQQASKSDGNQQQGFKSLHDGQVEHDEGHQQHDHVPPRKARET